MGKPNKKLKKILLITGVTGAVYGSFRCLLPLVVPFLFAWGLAVLLRPSAYWLAGRLRYTGTVLGKQRSFGVPVGVVGVAELLVISSAVLAGLYVGGRKLCMEASLLVSRIPEWIDRLDLWLTSICHGLETMLCLETGRLVRLAQEMLRGLLTAVKEAAMPFLMGNSVTLFRWGIAAMVVSVVVLVSTGLALQEMGAWKRRCETSVFCREYDLIARRLAIVANAYMKTQGVIMLLTAGICTAGFWLMGNPYFILAGVGIGLLDALPVFGTGTVLIPWAVILFFGGRWGQGLALIALYLACYFLREILEARLMGNRVGLSPLETLIAMYVGLQLFGIVGFILGPVGLLLIEDLVEAYEGEDPMER